MKVATEPYGKAEFNYPQVELIPFGSINPNRVIGGSVSKPKTEEQSEIDLNETEPVLPESVKKIEHEQSQPKPAQTVTSKPVVAPKQQSTAAPIPIPMAVPEGVR